MSRERDKVPAAALSSASSSSLSPSRAVARQKFEKNMSRKDRRHKKRGQMPKK